MLRDAASGQRFRSREQETVIMRTDRRVSRVSDSVPRFQSKPSFRRTSCNWASSEPKYMYTIRKYTIAFALSLKFTGPNIRRESCGGTSQQKRAWRWVRTCYPEQSGMSGRYMIAAMPAPFSEPISDVNGKI